MIEQHLSVDPHSPIPLVAQLRAQVEWLIARRTVSEGDQLPPIRSLATVLGINFNTVRAAYKQLEADGLVTAQRGRGTTVLGYERNRHLATQPSTRSFTIGVIIPTHLEFYAPFLNALDSSSTDPSLLFICVAHQDPEQGIRYLDQLVAKNVDGIIIAGAMVPAEIVSDVNGQPPIVFADFPGAQGPSVLFDHEEGSALATAHMLEHGHRRIGFIAPPRELPSVGPKYDGFERALARAGVNFRAELSDTAADFAVESGYRSALRLLTRDAPPTAIVAASDSLAIGTIRAARELAISIPEQLAVVGNDDIASASDTAPPLTTVMAPAAELGSRAIGMLEQLIAGEPLEPASVTLSTQLVVRQSCGC